MLICTSVPLFMNKKYYIAVASMALIITTAGTSIIVSASEIDSDKFEGKKMHKFEINHDEVKAAVEAGDYATFASLVVDTPLAKNVTEENFDKFVEAHTLMQAGDFEGAKAIREELGFKTKPRGQFKHERNAENKEIVFEAIETGDYSAWKEAVGDRPIAEKITEENFSQLAEMHNLIQNGDKEGAKAIAEELDIHKKKGKFGKQGKMRFAR